MATSINDSSCRRSHELPRSLHDDIHSARFGHRRKRQQHRLSFFALNFRDRRLFNAPAMQLPVLSRTLRRLFATGDFLLPADDASGCMQNRLHGFQGGIARHDDGEIAAPAAGFQTTVLILKKLVLGRADPLRCDRVFIRRTLDRERVGQKARRRLRHMLLLPLKNATFPESKKSWNR